MENSAGVNKMTNILYVLKTHSESTRVSRRRESGAEDLRIVTKDFKTFVRSSQFGLKSGNSGNFLLGCVVMERN